MCRRAAIVALLACLGLSGCGEPGTSEDTRPARHIVLISVDTLRADHLSCYGYERPTSPHLDALAAESWLFTRAQAHSSSTAPSHMSLFTGVLPLVHDVWNRSETALSPAVPTLAEQLGAAGYRTSAFADGGFVVGRLGFDRGFDAFDSRYERFPEKLDRIETWLGTAPDEPTFLFVHTYGVHAPYIPEPGHDRFTGPGYVGVLRSRVMALSSRMHTPGRESDLGVLRSAFWEGRDDFDETDRQYLVDLYDGCIHSVDAGVGRLLDMLDAKGWLDDAWVIVTADHGEAFLEHGSWSHRQLHGEELHVPLLVRPPGGLDPGQHVDLLVGLIDVTATVLDLGGVQDDAVGQGRSLLPVEALQPRAVHATSDQTHDYQTITSGTWKLHLRGDAERWQLYDLATDAGEHHDRLAEEDTAAIRESLVEQADAVRAAARALRELLGDARPTDAPTEAELEVLRALGYLR